MRTPTVVFCTVKARPNTAGTTPNIVFPIRATGNGRSSISPSLNRHCAIPERDETVRQALDDVDAWPSPKCYCNTAGRAQLAFIGISARIRADSGSSADPERAVIAA
jgi:hypothetical protein